MDTTPTEISTLSLHDALPIFMRRSIGVLLIIAALAAQQLAGFFAQELIAEAAILALFALSLDLLANCGDRKSTRLNSSHTVISYAVFCLKKKINRSWQCCR